MDSILVINTFSKRLCVIIHNAKWSCPNMLCTLLSFTPFHPPGLNFLVTLSPYALGFSLFTIIASHMQETPLGINLLLGQPWKYTKPTYIKIIQCNLQCIKWTFTYFQYVHSRGFEPITHMLNQLHNSWKCIHSITIINTLVAHPTHSQILLAHKKSSMQYLAFHISSIYCPLPSSHPCKGLYQIAMGYVTF